MPDETPKASLEIVADHSDKIGFTGPFGIAFDITPTGIYKEKLLM